MSGVTVQERSHRLRICQAQRRDIVGVHQRAADSSQKIIIESLSNTTRS